MHNYGCRVGGTGKEQGEEGVSNRILIHPPCYDTIVEIRLLQGYLGSDGGGCGGGFHHIYAGLQGRGIDGVAGGAERAAAGRGKHFHRGILGTGHCDGAALDGDCGIAAG